MNYQKNVNKCLILRNRSIPAIKPVLISKKVIQILVKIAKSAARSNPIRGVSTSVRIPAWIPKSAGNHIVNGPIIDDRDSALKI